MYNIYLPVKVEQQYIKQQINALFVLQHQKYSFPVVNTLKLKALSKFVADGQTILMKCQTLFSLNNN